MVENMKQSCAVEPIIIWTAETKKTWPADSKTGRKLRLNGQVVTYKRQAHFCYTSGIPHGVRIVGAFASTSY